ncbi:MAG: AAA family ATPase [Actinomycetota bacterium]|nr:AAA family ATPase [Actinomycetota bacterium]
MSDASATGQALKTVTVLFTDMVDWTSLGERFDPESLHSVTREYFGTIKSIAERYGGSVEKFIGDAVVAVFGIPSLHEDDALRAVSAAVEIHRSIDELRARLERDAGVTIQVRTGINTGEVLSQTATGASGRFVGDAVNVAARLQQSAAPGEILIGPGTHDLVKDRVRSDLLEPLMVKGRAAPVVAHRLLEVSSAPVAHARPKTPIVGRDREVHLLHETLDRVGADRTPHLFTVLGAPGVGKSRLVAELDDEESALVLHGRCLPYGDGITYWPLAEIVQTAAGIESGDAPEAARAKLAASAGEDEEAAAVAERVAQVLSLSEAGSTTDDLFWGIRKYFERLARQRPLVVVIDDVHWAEPTMLELLDHLVDSIGDVPLLVVCIARLDLMELRPAWGGGKMNATSLVLGPLKEVDCRELLGSLLGDSPAVDEVAAAVFRVADGNPLFVEEMVSMLMDRGLLEQIDGRWKAVRDLASVTVPPTIQALVAARLDRLSLEEREVVGMAAVMGEAFAPRAVSELAPGSVGVSVDETLGRLTKKQLVAPGDVEFAGSRMYSFRHLLIRDTAYEHLPRMARATIHERYAEWLVDVLGDRSAEFDEIVGYHLEQAYRYRESVGPLTDSHRALAAGAAARLAEGGRRAAARQDAPAAVKLLSRAVELLPERDVKRLDVLPDLGLALYEAGDYSAAIGVFDDAIELATTLDDARTATRCRIFKERARIHRDPQVDDDELRAVAEDAVEVLAKIGDDAGLSHAWDLVAYVHDCAGRSEEALAALRQAAAHAEKSGIASIIGYQRRTLLRSLAWGPGEVAEIMALAEELLDSSREVHDRYSEARALLTLAQANAMIGRFDVAREYIRLQKEICADISLEFIDAFGAFERAQVEVLAGNIDAAEAETRAGVEVLQRMGEKGVLPTLQVQLADLLYRKGRLDEAERVVQEAKRLSAPDDSLTEMKWRAVLAKVSAQRGNFDAALELATEASEIASATGFMDWQAGILADRAEVLLLAARPEEARRTLRRAAALYGHKGNLAAQRAVESRLDDVTPV